jgi:uncharacterized protein (TIGR03118 family)
MQGMTMDLHRQASLHAVKTFCRVDDRISINIEIFFCQIFLLRRLCTMAFVKRPGSFLTPVIAGVILLTVASFALLPRVTARASEKGSDRFYVQTNLVSDLPNIAKFQDKNLVNSWGLVHGPNTPWWVADNGTGLATTYNGGGQPLSRIVTIPPPAGVTTAAPTGIVFNNVNSTNPDDFVVSENGNHGASVFMFATEDGTISGWNPNVDATHAILAVDRSQQQAVYKGLAIGQSNGKDFIYATNFRFGQVEMFDAHFHLVKSFTDPELFNNDCSKKSCFAPFGIRNINGQLFVTFALQDAARHDDVAGPGNGFVDVFDTNGNLLRHFASQGKLDSPWGLTLTPKDFGPFSNDLLVGNFGDGHINVLDPQTGKFLGQLPDQEGDPIAINGLWGLDFGNGNQAGETDELFFASGLNDEANGLFGKIQFVTDK